MKQKNPLKEEIGVRLNTLLSYPIDVDGLGGMTSCLTSFMVEHDLPSDHNSESGPEAT